MFGRFKPIAVLAAFSALFIVASDARGARLKDLAFIEGVRSNQLVG